MLENLTSTWLGIVGLALLPTPPSIVPDFGTQFLLSLTLGVYAPERVVKPFSKFFFFLASGPKRVLGKIPGASYLIRKVDSLYQIK